VAAVVRTTPARFGAPVLHLHRKPVTIQVGAARAKLVVVQTGTRLVTPRRRDRAAVQRPVIARPAGIRWRTSAEARVPAPTRVAAGQRRRAAAAWRIPAIAARRLGPVAQPRVDAMRKALMVAGTAVPAVRWRQPMAPNRSALPRLDYVRGPSGRTEAPAVPAAFAPAARPTVAAGTARRAVQPAPEIERVVRELHEQLTVRLERTVREQVQQRLTSRSRFTRGLADRIQSELYHDIVFERERLGHGRS
jgi:hypothetical protein